jgi:hypothetical protein
VAALGPDPGPLTWARQLQHQHGSPGPPWHGPASRRRRSSSGGGRV